jgi:predicted NACHT family NTPase
LENMVNPLSPSHLLQELYPCFLMLKNLTNCINYKDVQNNKIRNILVLGNIGQGKSTTLNKLHMFLSNDQNTSLEESPQ